MLKRLFLLVTATAFVVVPVILASSDMLVLEDFESSSPATVSKKTISRDHEKGEYPRRFIEPMRRKEEEYFQDSRTEAEQVNAYFHLMSLIEAICQEGLQREDQLEYVTMWMSAIYTLAEEAGEANALKASYEDNSKLVLKRTVAFGKQFKRPSSDSDSSESTYSAKVHDFNDEAHDNMFASSKSKMMSGEYYESEDEKDDFVEETALNEVTERDVRMKYANTVRRDSRGTDYGTFVEYVQFSEEKADELSSSSSYSSGDDDKVVTRESAGVKRRGRRVGRGPGGVSLTDALGVAADVMMTSTTMTAEAGSEDGKVSAELAIGAMAMLSGANAAENSAGNSNAISEELMDRMQEQLLAKIMAQLQNQTAGTGLNSLGEQVPSELVVKELLGEDLYALPEMNRESLINFLRTSALPKLLNNLIKEKTGVNVLKNLAMALKLLNEGLGSVEIILKMLIRVTRAVRYYVLFASQVVKDMSREENEPLVDLSVSMDILPAKPKKKSSITRGMTKMFQRSLRKKSKGLGDEDGDTQKDMSPFSLSMQAALSKARDYKSEFQKIPPILLLKVIHTVFAELEKRNGVIRVAITRKKHKTLVGLQESISGAVERVYEAISMHDPSCSEQLHALPPIIFTDILISLISHIEMKPLVLEKHLEEVTSWVKQFMVILDAEAQLAMLNFLLNEPEMPEMPAMKRKGLQKRFSWTFSNQHHK